MGEGKDILYPHQFCVALDCRSILNLRLLFSDDRIAIRSAEIVRMPSFEHPQGLQKKLQVLSIADFKGEFIGIKPIGEP